MLTVTPAAAAAAHAQGAQSALPLLHAALSPDAASGCLKGAVAILLGHNVACVPCCLSTCSYLHNSIAIPACTHTPVCHAPLSPAAAGGCLQGPVAILPAHTEHCLSATLPAHPLLLLLLPTCRTPLQSCLPASSDACLQFWMARVTAPAVPS